MDVYVGTNATLSTGHAIENINKVNTCATLRLNIGAYRLVSVRYRLEFIQDQGIIIYQQTY